MGDLAGLMIGILLMLMTTVALCGFSVMQYAGAMNRRVRVPVRDMFETLDSEQSRRAE